MLRTPPLGLYVHLPWCVQKCPYCDFNSHPLRGALQEGAYLTALLSDLEQERARAPGRRLQTVFFGGGTPSLFSPKAIGRVLDAVDDILDDDAEITLEANPGTVEHGRFSGYRDAGVNRLSIGAQSFDNATLKVLGRIHNADETRRAVDEARTAGFDNYNIDLMYALPHQTQAGALDDLEHAIALAPAHISHYQLTLEPQTLFAKHPPPLPDDDSAWAMQQDCQQRLADAGFAQYETSAYARPGRRCAHNLNYWRFGDYLAIGAGAHGKLTFAHDNRIERRAKARQPGAYMRTGEFSTRTVSARERVFEFMLNVLRLHEGFSLTQLTERTACSREAAEPGLSQALTRGLLTQQGEDFKPTAQGRRFLNDLQLLFLDDASA